MSQVNRSAFAAAARGDGGPRKSPLRLATDPVPVVSAGSSRAPDPIAAAFPRCDLSPAQQRQVMISEYGEWLRWQTNRHGRPFQPEDWRKSSYSGANGGQCVETANGDGADLRISQRRQANKAFRAGSAHI